MTRHLPPALGRFCLGLGLGAVLGLALRPLPLFGTLTYEYALAAGVALFFLCLSWGVVDGQALVSPPYATRWKSLTATTYERFRGGLGKTLAGSAGLVLAALAVPAVLEPFTTHCAWERGVAVYLYVLVPVAPQAYALGLLAGVGRRPRRRALVLTVGYVAGSILLTAYEGLAGPRAVLHNVLVGLVAGTGYTGLDAEIKLEPSFLLHRLVGFFIATFLAARAVALASEHAAVAADDPVRAAILLGAHAREARRVARLAVLGLVVMALDPGPFGLGGQRGVLEQTLSGSARTRHFLIRYRRGSEVERHLESVAEAHEWALDRLTRLLAMTPPDEPVVSYVYADDEDLERVTGARGYLFAKPWLNAMHTRFVAGWGAPEIPSLRHELAHVLAARFGLPGLRISADYGLVEGFAEAAADEYGWVPESHAPFAAALRRGLLPRAETAVSTRGFASHAAQASYGAAGSFCGWLLATYGPAKLTRVYAWGDFAEVYGLSLDELDRGWREFLGGVASGPREMLSAVSAFTERPFFKSPCPRLGRRRDSAEAPAPVSPCEDAPSRSARERLAAAECMLASQRRDAGLALLGLLVGDDHVDVRDRALSLLSREATRDGDRDEALAWLEARRSLGWVGPVHLGLARAAIVEPALESLLDRDTKPVDPASPGDGLEALVRGFSLVEAGTPWSAPLAGTALMIGGCGRDYADAEAWVLVGASRAARAAGDGAIASQLLDNAASLAPGPWFTRRVGEERERLAWARGRAFLVR